MSRLALSDLLPNTQYAVQVRSIASDGRISDWSPRVTFTTLNDTVLPSIPTGVTWVSTGDSFHAEWNPVTTNVNGDLVTAAYYEVVVTNGATEKTLSVSPVSSGNKVTFDLTFQQNAAIFGTPKATVLFKVRVVDGRDLKSAYSTTLSASNPAPATPTAPAVGSVATAGQDSISLAWTEVSDNDLAGYNVYVGLTENFTPTSGNRIYSGLGTRLTYSTTNYSPQYFKIFSADKFGLESLSFLSGNATPTSSFAADTTPPATPTNVTASITNAADGNSASLTVNWDLSPVAADLAGFRVKYRIEGTSITSFVSTDDTVRSVVIPVQAYTNYKQISVQAYDGFGNDSAYSTPLVSANSPVAAAPGNVTGLAAKPGRDSITYNWNATTDLDIKNYELTFSTTSDFSSNNTTYLTGTATTVTVSGLSASSTYYARVRAVNKQGTTSAAWSATLSSSTTAFPTTPLTDGFAPQSSPTPNVQSGLSYLYATWSPILTNSNNGTQVDPVTYEVHLSITSGFTPAPATKVTEVSGTFAIIDILPGTVTPLSYGTPYFVKLIAKDRDGAAAASAQGSAQIAKVAGTDSTLVASDVGAPTTGQFQQRDSLNSNALFMNWVGAGPDDWSNLVGGLTPIKETSIVLTKPNASRFTITDTANASWVQYISNIANPEYVTLSVDFYLVSGSLSGSGVALLWTDSNSANNSEQYISFLSEVPSPVTGKWYRLTKTFKRPTSVTNFTQFRLYYSGNSTSFGSKTAKDIIFDQVTLAIATQAEIDGYEGRIAAGVAQTTANTKNTTFTQGTTPSANKANDIWIDTANGNIIKIATAPGTANWVPYQDTGISTAQTTANGKNAVFVQSATPTATKVGDIWIDTGNGNVVKTWEGSSWVVRQDTGIASAQNSANTAQATANGKNNVYYSLNAAPTATTGYTNGDTWFQKNGSGSIIAQWEFISGTGFVSKMVGSQVIANLDVGKLSAGTIGAIDIILGTNGNIRSNDYVSGSAGFKLQSGSLEVNNGVISAATLKAGTTITNNLGVTGTLTVSTTGTIQSANYSSTAGYKISNTGIEMNDANSKISAAALQGGTISATSAIVLGPNANLIINGGYIKSNTYTGTSYNPAIFTGFYIGNDGIRIGSGSISADAFAAGTINGSNILVSSTGAIQSTDFATGTAGWRLSTNGLQINNGSITAPALNIGIGTDNLIPNSSFETAYGTSDTTGWLSTGGGSISTNTAFKGVYSYLIVPVGNARQAVYRDLPARNGQKYTISLWVFPQGADAQLIVHDTNGGNTVVASSSGTGFWQRLVIKGWTANSTNAIRVHGYSPSNGTDAAYFDAFQLEEGEFATTWSLADGETSTLTKIDGTMITTGAIRSNVSSTINGQTYWNWQLDKAGNFYAGGNAKLYGDVTVGGSNTTASYIRSFNYSPGSSGWNIDATGNAELNNATIRGTLVAGSIQSNVSITGALYQTSAGVGTGTSGVKIDASGIRAYTGSTQTIAITNSGGISLTGNLDANGGTITGGTVQTGPVGTMRTVLSGARISTFTNVPNETAGGITPFAYDGGDSGVTRPGIVVSSGYSNVFPRNIQLEMTPGGGTNTNYLSRVGWTLPGMGQYDVSVNGITKFFVTNTGVSVVGDLTQTSGNFTSANPLATLRANSNGLSTNAAWYIVNTLGATTTRGNITVSNNTTITINVSGWYHLSGSLAFDSAGAANTRRIVGVERYTGTAPAAATGDVLIWQEIGSIAPGGSIYSLAFSRMVYCVAGQIFRLLAYQNSGQNVAILGASNGSGEAFTRIEMTMIP